MLAGFKEFIARGNAIDLAVGVIIGGAFTTVINAIVDDILNPFIGGLFGRPDFTDAWHITFGMLGDPAVIKPFSLLTALINFLLIAAALYYFIIVPMNKLAARRKAEDVEPEAPTDDVRLLTEIRDLLADGQRGRPGGV